MADEDPLNALRSSLQKSGLDSADASSRQSRALRRPIDATPETFMGASVAAVADGSDGAKDGEGGPDAAPPRRMKRVPRNRTAAAGGTVLDPNLFSQFANTLRGTVGKASTPEVTEEKIAPASPSPTASPLQKEPTPEPREPTPEPKEPTPEPKIPTPPPVVLLSPSPSPSRMVAAEEVEETIKQASLEAKQNSTPSPPPAFAKVLSPSTPDTEEKLERLSKELEALRQKYEEDKERLEDYEALCENLVPDGSSGARPLAHFISDLMENKDQLDEMRQAQVKIQQELSDLHEKLAEETCKNAELSTAMTIMKEEQQHQASAVDNSKLLSLQDALVAKDEEIAQLREQLKQSSVAATAGTMAFPSRDEIEKMRQEEDEAFQMAEKELEMMEALIKEQEEYLARMEEHLGAFDFEGKSLSELKKAKEHLGNLAIDKGPHEAPSPGVDLEETTKEPEEATAL